MKKSTDRRLDIAIGVTALLVVALGAYLGYMVWSNTGLRAVSSPSGRAVEKLREGVTANPANPLLRVKLAEALTFAGRTSEAVEQYNAALKIKKDYVPALSGLATLAMEDKQYPTAVTYWKRIVTLLEGSSSTRSPDLEGAYYGLGVTYLDMKKYEDAVANLKESLRIKSDASDTHYMMSLAYRGLGYEDKQREELTITLAFDPNNAQASYDLGLILLKEGDVAAAAELFRLSSDRAPAGVDLPGRQLAKIAADGNAAVRLAKATALELTEPSVALAEARIAAALDPKDVKPVRIAARLWEKKGVKDQALKANERILELVPQDPEATEAIKRLSADGS